MPKIKSVKTTTVVEKTAVSVVEEHEVVSVNYSSEPDYIKIYLNTIMYLVDIPMGVSDVMKCVLMQLPYASDEVPLVVLNGFMKKMFAKKIGKSEQFVSDSITKLVKGKLLFRVGGPHSATFQVNPHVFGRGKWEDIKKLQLNVAFSPEGKTFWGEVQRGRRARTKK